QVNLIFQAPRANCQINQPCGGNRFKDVEMITRHSEFEKSLWAVSVYDLDDGETVCLKILKS
ncbi:MAG: hypothetical protein QW812_05640, partial [Thermoplasmataceae archaeon]